MTDDKKIPAIDRATRESNFADRATAKPLLVEKDALSEHAQDGGASTAHSTVGAKVSASDPVPSGTLASDSAPAAGEPVGVNAPTANMPNAKLGKKKKVEIETLEQFILKAYSLKGRKVVLSGAVEKRIGHQPTLDIAAVERALVKSRGDLLFAVPRQLLLVARDIHTYPALRGAIRGFVKTAILAHPLFANPHIVAAVNNLPEAPSVVDAMSTLASSELPLELRSAGKPVIKAAQFNELRANAVYCLAVWFRDTRDASVSELNDALYRALWSQSAANLRDERAKLRALTELRDLAAAGLACSEFRAAATERMRQMDTAQQAASQAQAEVANLGTEIEQLRETHELRVAELERQVQGLKTIAERNRTESQNELTHLRDDLEQQRTRVLRRLKADVALLDEGLTAIRRDPPKVHVTDDHVERVADALRHEIKKLESGE